MTKNSVRPYEVGELGSLWSFVSDHLPIGATIGRFHIASWNVLNEQYIHHIQENGQGLKGSLITQLHGLPGVKGLTLREEIVFGDIIFLTDGRYPRSIIALQEVSKDLSKYLWKNRPPDWEILSPAATNHREQIFLYKKSAFEFVDSTYAIYDKKSPKVVFVLTLLEKSSGAFFRCIQTHIPLGAEDKFAKEVVRHFDPHLTTILMGDMNAHPSAIQEALRIEQESMLFHPLTTSYPTHINRERQACWYDAFFVYNPDKIHMVVDSAETFFGNTSVAPHRTTITVAGVATMATLLEQKA